MGNGNGGKIRIFQALGGIVVLLVLGVIGWAIWSSMQPSKPMGVVTIVPQASARAQQRQAGGATTRQSGAPQASARQFRTPLEVLKAHKTPLPQLIDWATKWNGGAASDIPSLTQQIVASDLSAEECLQIGQMVNRGGEPSAGLVWVSAGADRAQIQLADLDHDDQTAQPVLTAMGRATNGLYGNDAAGPLLEKVNALAMKFDRINQWDQTPEYARLHHAQALVMEQKYAQAKTEVTAMQADTKKNTHWTDQQKTELASLDARIPFEADAKTPLDVLKAHQLGVSGELMAWAANWGAAYPGNQPNSSATTASDVDLDGLSATIKKSDLSAIECLRIARMVEDAKDMSTAEAWAAVGASRAVKETANLKHDDKSVLPLIDSLERVQDPLWQVRDMVVGGQILENVTSILIMFDRENNSDQRVEWAKVGHLESLFMQSLITEGIAEGAIVSKDMGSNTHWTDQQRAGFHFAYGLLLYTDKRYQQAAPELSQASEGEYPHAEQASVLYLNTLIALGKREEAKVFLSQCQKRYPWGDLQVNLMASAIDDGNISKGNN